MGAGTGAQNSAESPDSEPRRFEDRSFSTECSPRRLPFAQYPVCKRPPNAEYSQKCTPHPTPGTRSKKTNGLGEYVNAGPSGLRLTISIGDL